MRRCIWILGLATLAIGAALATAGRAQTLPRLPDEFAFQVGEGSLGQVIFNHRTHVDQERPDCTVCHPSLFRILAKGAPAEGGAIGHAEMVKGRQCGACHNDRDAFGIENGDNCANCHRVSDP